MAYRRPSPRKGNSSSRPGAKKPGGPPGRRPKPGGPPNRPQAARHAQDQRDRGPAPSRGRGAGSRPPQGKDDGLERLQKILAHAGVGSRRACEELILQGRVTVDNQVVRELGTRVDPRTQQVALDGQKIHAERNVYYAVNKPKGYVSTNSDPSGKPLVVDILPEIPQRVYSVGRLDEQSTGLMLLTNDGELANRLAHPRFGVEKVYRVVVAGEPPREVLDQLTQGIWLAEGKVRAKRVRMVGRKGQASVMEMVLAEGKNREIRRMMAKLGHKVMSLTRIAIGPIALKGLAVGGYRPLTAQEIDLLRKVAAGIAVPTPRYADVRPRIPRPGGPGRTTRPQGEARAQDEAGHRETRPPRPLQGGGRPPRPEGQNRPQGPMYQHQGGRPPRPEGQNRPPMPPRPLQGGGPPRTQGQNRPPMPPRPGDQRPAGQGRPPRPVAGGRPPQSGSHGPMRGRPPQGQGTGPLGPPPSKRPRPPVPSRDEGPTRKIIGMEPEAAQDRPGPRQRRPVPKRAPRAALGVKRRPRRGGGDNAGND